MVIQVIFVSLAAVGIGLALALGASKLEGWSQRLQRRAPHLLPLRTEQPARGVYVWLLRFFGAMWALAGLALLYFGR